MNPINATALNFKHALVTGGAGFIGSHLVDALLAHGCGVTVLDNLTTGKMANLNHVTDKIDFHQDDICNLATLDQVIRGCDVIFHQAAVVSVPQTVEKPIESAMVNDMGTLFVLEAARRQKIKRVVLASSCAVYGDDPRLPKHENMIPEPTSPYALQKLTGEYQARLYHRLYGLETVCLRYFNVYGPRQDPTSPYSGVISIFMSKAIRKEAPVIYGSGDQYRDFVYVADVVRANLLASCSQQAAGSVYNVGTGSFVTVNALWDMVCRFADLKTEPIYRSSRPGDILKSLADIKKAGAALGFFPQHLFEQGLETTYEWYKTNV